MDFKTLKSGFKRYLREYAKTSDNKYILNDSDTSIFIYADEFKNYLHEKLNVSLSDLNKSTKDILNMKIVDGKLVDKNAKKKKADKNDDEEEGLKIKADLSDDSDIIQDEQVLDEAVDELTQQMLDDELNDQESQGLTDNQENEPLFKEDEENISDEENLTDDEEIFDNPELITDILNDLLRDESFKKAIDANSDGKINKKELKAFCKAAKGYDNDEKTISLEDIIGVAKDIEDGKFELKDNSEEDKKEKEEKTEETQISAPHSSGGGGGGGSYSNTPINSTSPIANNTTDDKTSSDDNLSNLSTQELEAQLTTAQNDMVEKQEALSSAISGETDELQDLKKTQDEAWETYQQELEKTDKDLADKVDDKKTEIDSTEEEITKKEAEISEQETVIKYIETSKTASQTRISNLENTKSTLENQNSKDNDTSAQIEEIESQIEAEKENLKEIESQLEDANNELNSMNEQKDGLDETYAELSDEMAALEEETVQKYPQIEEYKETYETSKEEYEKAKDDAISAASKDVEASLDEINKIQEAINEAKNNEDAKTYNISNPDEDEFGDNVSNLAQQFVGTKGSDTFTGGKAAPGGWCAAFVEYVLQNSGSWENTAQWYKNCSDRWSCAQVLEDAQNNNAVIDASTAQKGDMIIFYENGKITHSALVSDISDSKVKTVEGNVSNSVKEGSYDINDNTLIFLKTSP